MVSVIISYYKRISHLQYCLNTLAFNRSDFSEVLITDDGSDEATVQQIRQITGKYPFPIRHVWQPKDGFRLAASRNNGIRAAQGDYLIFIDCDFALLPGAIKAHTDAAKPGRFVGGLCKYLPEQETSEAFQKEPTRELLELYYNKLPERPIKREHHRFIRYNLLSRLHLANPRKARCSSHFSIYKKDIEFINGYDENFRGWGGEDEDLAIRLIKAGFHGYSVIPRARVLHMWHPKELGDKHWQEGANIAYLNRRHIPFKCENGLSKAEDTDHLSR